MLFGAAESALRRHSRHKRVSPLTAEAIFLNAYAAPQTRADYCASLVQQDDGNTSLCAAERRVGRLNKAIRDFDTCSPSGIRMDPIMDWNWCAGSRTTCLNEQ